jgi:hypothetical protein
MFREIKNRIFVEEGKKINLIAGGAFSCMTEEFQRFRSKNTNTVPGSRFYFQPFRELRKIKIKILRQ